jgi:hypothetical protein
MKHFNFYSAFIILLIVLQAHNLSCIGQDAATGRDRALSFEVGFARTNILGIPFPGMSGHYIFFLSEKFGTGFSLFSVQNQIDQNFGLSLVNPQLMLSQYGWINQFILLNNKYVKFKLDFTNGLLQVRLLDQNPANFTGPIITTPHSERNLYYFIEPGSDLSLRLFGPLYITGGVNYRFPFGRSNFSSRKEFQNSGISLGLTMISNNK